MTVNDIEKVDYAIRNRPSRFKFQKKFDNPCVEIRKQFIGDWAHQVDNVNLDQVFRLQESQRESLSLQTALKRLECLSEEDLQKIAHNRYLERLDKGIAGSAEEDWQYAE